jgi:TolB-like protein
MSNSPSSLERLLADLKRRKVFRVMAVYGATAFVVLQVADLLAEGMGLSDQLLRVTTYLVLIGFPIAVVLAWAFESTPDGMKRTADAAPEEIREILAQPASKRIPAGLMALAGIVLLFGAWWMGRQGAAPELSLGVPAAQADTADFVTVAILPFENVGTDERNEVLADGLHMDLQQQLGQLSALRVTWPMSVREYRASEKGDREIAEELGVDYLLRGSVRRSGDLARVDVVLVDARSAEHLWGDQYDREVTPENLFDIQSGIALEVARRLATELSPADLAVLDQAPPSGDLAALAAYNRAREIFHNRGPGETIEDVAAQVERAVELDPDFVEAWAFLTRVRAVQAWAGSEEPELATEALRRTEALAPGSAQAISAGAFHAAWVESDRNRGLLQLQEARRIAPSDADIVAGIAQMQRFLGHWDEAVQTYREAIAVNPRSPGLLVGYALTLRDMGRMAASDMVYERALQVGSSIPGIRAAKVQSTFERYGDADRARGLAAELGLDVSEAPEAEVLFSLAMHSGEFDEAVRLASQVPRQESTIGELGRLWRRTWAGSTRGDDVTALVDSMVATGWSPTDDSWDEMMGFITYAYKGDLERAWPLLDEAVRIARGLDESTSAWQLDNAAFFYAEFGRLEQALDILEETAGAEAGFMTLTTLTHIPSFASLRGNPRFEAVVERRRAFEEQAALDAEADRPWLP